MKSPKKPTENPTDRLPWEAHPEGGFIAYPEGKDKPRRYARITLHSPTTTWAWSVAYDGQHIADIAPTTQEASNKANEAWPAVVGKAQKASERASWEAHQMRMIEAAERGEIEPSYFANEAASYENLMWVMDRIRLNRKRPFSLHLERLVDALSQEFFRRRSRR